MRVKGVPDKTRSFDTSEEAVKWANRVEMQLLAGEDTVPDLSSEMTLEEALDKYKEGRDRRLSDEEAAQLERELHKCRNVMVRLVVAFAVHTAARQGEILRRERKDVNLKRRTVIFRDTKNGDDRAVPLSQDALVIVEGLLKHHDGELVFPITRNALVPAWRRILKRADCRITSCSSGPAGNGSCWAAA